MGRPRLYATNAERQKAYRDRKRKALEQRRRRLPKPLSPWLVDREVIGHFEKTSSQDGGL